MIEIAPSKDVARINQILNAPEVRPWVASADEGILDVAAQVASPLNLFLLGDHGLVMLTKIMPGVYECHTACLSEGRGAWALDLVMSVQRWMFTRTDCFEILTRIPKTHRAALGLAIKAGMKLEFHRPDGVKINGEVVPVDVYRVSIQDWFKRTDEMEESGRQFHQWLNEEAAKSGYTQPHEDDPEHNRIVGLCLEMARHGQPVKGTLTYNRWAWISRHATISLISVDPIVLDMDIGQVRLTGESGLEFIPGAGSRCAVAGIRN